MDDLNILIKAKLASTKSEIETQIDALNKKITRALSIKIKVDESELNNTMSRIRRSTQETGRVLRSSANDVALFQASMNNRLARLQIGRETVFARPEIQAEMNSLVSNVARFGTVGGRSVRELNLQFAQLTTSVRSATNEITRINGAADSFLTTLSKNFVKMMAWGLVATAIYAPLRSLQAGLTTLKELDGLMVSIAKVTNLSAQAMENLKNSAFDAASAFGRTAQDYLKSIGEFSRAGYEGKASDLAKISLLSQNVGELTAEQANAFLLATDAAYKYKGSQEELMKVLDGVNIIDNKFATSIQKVSEGITVAGSIASNASVGINELSAAVGTMTAITQRSGNEAGRAFRSILMNIRQIKGETEDGEIIDDEALSKSAKALDSVGIKVHEMRNGIEELRNPMDVLQDLSNVWGSLSSMKTAPIIEALGGKYRGNQLVALVENFDMYKKMLEEYSNSSGSAMAENEIRMSSWETKINQLRNSINNFWNNTIDTNLVKGIIGSVTVLINNFGNLQTILGVIFSMLAINKGVAFLAFLKNLSLHSTLLNSSLVQTQARLAGLSFAQIGAMSTTNALNFAIKGLWATMIANPIGLVVTAVTSAILIFDLVGASAERSAQKQRDAFNELNRSINTMKQEIAEAKNLANEYEKLSGKTSLTTQEKTRLLEVQQKLATLMPDLIVGYDAENRAIIDTSDSVQQAIKDNKELLKTKQDLMADKFQTEASSNFSKLQEDQDKLNSLLKQKEEYLQGINDINSGKTSQFDSNNNDLLAIYKNNLVGIRNELSELQPLIQQEKKDLSELTNAFLQSGDAATSLGESTVKKLIYGLSNLRDEAKVTEEQLVNIFNGLKDSDFAERLNNAKVNLSELSKTETDATVIQATYNKTISSLSLYLNELGISAKDTEAILKDMLILPDALKAREKLFDVAKSIENVNSATEEYLESSKNLASTVAKMNDGHKLTTQELFKLIKEYPQLSEAIINQNGVLTLNREAIETVMQANDDAFKSKLENDRVELENSKALLMAKLYMYGQDIKGMKTVAEARAKEAEAYNTMSGDSGVKFAIHDTNMSTLADLQKIEDQLKVIGVVGQITPKDLVATANPDLNKKDSSAKSSLSEQVDIEESLIRSFQTEAKITEEKGKLLQKQIQNAKSQKDFNQEISLTNDLIKNQSTQISQLGLAKSKIEAEFAKVSSQSGFQNTSQWIDQQGEATLQYQNEWNASSVATQKLMSATFDKLSKLRKAWTDNGDSVNMLTENIVTLKSSLSDFSKTLATEVLESQKKLAQIDLDNEEKALKSYISRHELKIKNIQEEIDTLEKRNEKEEEQEERAKRLLDIEKAKQNLNNTLGEKDTRILVGDTWTWQANPEKVAEAQENLKSLQDDFTDWEEDNDLKHKKASLQAEIDYQQSLIDKRQESFNIQKTQFEEQWENIDALSTQLLEQYGSNVDSAVEILSTKLTDLNSELADLVRNSTSLTSSLSSLGNKSSSSSSSSSSSYGSSSDSGSSYKDVKGVGRVVSNPDGSVNSVGTKSGSYNEKTGQYSITNYKTGESVYKNGSKDDYEKDWDKMHEGGSVGKLSSNLKPDEIPKILQLGEFVLSKDMLKSIADIPKLNILSSLSMPKMPDLSKLKSNLVDGLSGETFNINGSVTVIANTPTEFFNQLKQRARLK